ncbi:MAG: SLBB domain-containing protein [Terriglobales bacterium]
MRTKFILIWLFVVAMVTVRSQGAVLFPASSAQTQQYPAQPQMQSQPQPQAVPQTPNPQIMNLPPEGEHREQEPLPPEDRRRQPVQSLLPPEPDIEFQDFVAASLGYRLPIFGEDLFRNVPSTFAPLDRVPVPSGYLIGPGDELLIRTWGQIDINSRAVVDRNGAIYLPKVGSLTVAGLRYEQLHDYLQTAIGRVFKNFEFTATLGQLRSIQVFVVGQVRRPGTYTVSSLSTLVNALFAAAGPSKRGSMRRIQLKRQSETVTTFDLYDLLLKGDKSRDSALLPGDVIYVPPVGELVALAGSVNVPGIFELKEHETLADAISYAGGLTTTAAAGRAIVERIDERHLRTAAEFPLTIYGLKQELRDGDVVRFLHISARFGNAVTLRGNVAIPGRYPWLPGMRVRDLIPSREALITEKYWKLQNRLALTPADENYEPLLDNEKQGRAARRPEDQSRVQSNTQPETRYEVRPDAQSNNPPETTGPEAFHDVQPQAQQVRPEEIKNEIKRSAAEINWEYAVIERLDREDLTTHLLPFNLGKAIGGDNDQNLPLEAGDVITIFSQADLQVPIGQQSKFVRLEGEFRAAGIYRAEPGETLRHLVGRAGGLTAQAYLYGAEFTRESTRKDQQDRLDEYVNELEKAVERSAGGLQARSGDEALAAREALEGQRRLVTKLRLLRANGRIVLGLVPGTGSLDQIPDLVLEDGDRLLVPFRPATVNVIGVVHNSNAFVFKPGRTTEDYLRTAGGATPDGDRGRAFVIRADGSSVGAQGHHGMLGNSFNNLRLEPGDTLVIPEKLNKGATLRAFKDWTQIIGQFVIGAAAAKVLFP